MSANTVAKNMLPEKQLTEFVNRLRKVARENLQSVILYGSAAGGEFHPDFSNLNLLCIVHELSFSVLIGLAPAVDWWTQQKHAAPLIFTRAELERSADTFAIEFLDMQRRHRLLFGDDVLSSLHIPMHLHNAQLEYELREKMILLRQSTFPAAGNSQRMWELLLRSLPAFTTLFRHTLIALGEPAPESKRSALQALSARIPFGPSAFLQLLDIREGKLSREQLDVGDVFARYLAAVQQVVSAVDTMLEPAGPGSSY
jgi:hypothetical protein